MTKAKKYSLDYWVKKCMNAWAPEKDILAAVQEFVKNGTHSQIAFTGTPLEFAHALYLSRFKRGMPWTGFFPTPAPAAEQAANLLPINRGAIVLDPGCGFGALSHAVQQRGAVPIMVEYSGAVVMIAQAVWGEDRVHYSDFLDGFRPTEFDAVITNPPFGKIFGHSDAAEDFLERIADLSRGGTPVAAILPRGYLTADRPRRRVEIAQRFTILDRTDWPEDIFSPLAKISTTLYLLTVKCDGRLLGEVLPRETPANTAAAPVEAAIDVFEAEIDAFDAPVEAVEAAIEAEAKLTPDGEEDTMKKKGATKVVEPAVVVPEAWHRPGTFEFYLEDQIVRVEYDGAESIGFDRGTLHFGLHGPTISSTGYRSHFAEYNKVAACGTPEMAAIEIAKARAAETLVELKKNKKKWPVDLPEEVLIKIDEVQYRARPISWNDFNRWWYMWLIEEKTAKTVILDQILDAAAQAAAARPVGEQARQGSRPTMRSKKAARQSTVSGSSWVRPVVEVPAAWHTPGTFEFQLAGHAIRVEYHGSKSIGFQNGSLQFGFHGDVVSETGFYSRFAQYTEAEQYGNPEMAAIELAKGIPSVAAVMSVPSSPERGETFSVPTFGIACISPLDMDDAAFEAWAACLEETSPQTIACWRKVRAEKAAQNIVSWPLLPDGCPRAGLPEGLREQLEATPWHFLKAKSTDRTIYQSWCDDAIVLMHPEVVSPPDNVWYAGYFDAGHELKMLRLSALDDESRVQGATVFQVLTALRDHLAAWDVAAWVRLRPHPQGWTAAAVLELANVVGTHEEAVLVADDTLGLPTIHLIPHPDHMGFGMFRAVTNEYTINYDAGGSMARLSHNGLGYTHVQVERGTFPFDKAGVLDTLDHWACELALTEGADETQSPLPATCSNCFAVHVDGPTALTAGWVIEAPYWFCPDCVARGIHTPGRAEESAPSGEAVGVLTGHKVAQVEAAGYRFVFGEMDEAAKEALVGLGAGRGNKLDMLRARHLTVEKVASATEPVVSVETLCRFNNAREWAAWCEQHRAEIAWFVPAESLKPPVEIKVGLKADRLKTYLRGGAPIQFKDLAGQSQVGEFAKMDKRGRFSINTFDAQHEITSSFAVDVDHLTLVTLDFSDKPKAAPHGEVSTEQSPSLPIPPPQAGWAARRGGTSVAGSVKPEPVVKKVKQLNLPDGVPEVIEVDVGGRTPVWVAASIVKVDGQKMMCRRADNGDLYKTKLYGRDIEWRVPSLAAISLAA